MDSMTELELGRQNSGVRIPFFGGLGHLTSLCLRLTVEKQAKNSNHLCIFALRPATGHFPGSSRLPGEAGCQCPWLADEETEAQGGERPPTSTQLEGAGWSLDPVLQKAGVKGAGASGAEAPAVSLWSPHALTWPPPLRGWR